VAGVSWALCAMAMGGLAGRAAGDAGAEARAVLEAAGGAAGLCVHVGVGDPALTAALAQRGGLLVHGLALDANALAAARRHIERAGLYGQASVDVLRGGRLPYVDGTANLVVVDDMARAAAAGLTNDEVLRVLAPGGVAVLRGGVGNGVGKVLRKSRPATMDEWTHRAHDAGGSCVSRDTAVGPLASLRWIAGPAWPMGTGYQESNGGSVSAGGRVFHVTLNEASNAARLPQTRNDTWFLTARDAHNGLLLWARPIGRKRRRDGQEFADFLVATERRVFALIGEDLVGLDPATGRTVRIYQKDIALTGRLAMCGGLLVLSQPGRLSAIDPNTGETRWQHPVGAADVLAAGGSVLYTTPDHKRLTCVGLADGARRWDADLAGFHGRKQQLLFVAEGVAVYVWERDWQKGANGIAAFSAADGKRLWSAEYESARATWANTAWPVGGLIWHREGKAGMVGRSPATGECTRRITLRGGYCGGCVRNIVTERFLVSTRPPNFLAWKDGQAYPFRAGRHGCRAGVIVANGLLYSQPHGCKCVRESVRGFVAFGPAPSPGGADLPRLELGPASAPIRNATLRSSASLRSTSPQSAIRNPGAWPTFRRDARRSGGTAAEVPAELRPLWQTKIDDQKLPAAPLADEWLTAPVVAGGCVYAALRDAHRLVALDANTGQPRWSFTAGGRIDVPPTIHRGLCLFGSHDGWVYCLRAADGRLVWRFRAAPAERRIVAFGQVESAWPVVGGVLVDGNTAFCVAGRSSAADGGLHGYALRPETGEVVWARTLPAACSDLLVMDGGALRLAGGASAGERFDPATGEPLRRLAQAGFKWDFAGKIGTLWGGPNRVLDRTWHVLSVNDTASHWMRIKQGYGPHEGHLLVASPDGGRVFGFRFHYVHWSKVKEPETEFGGELLAWQGGKQLWKLDVPKAFQPEAMCLAGDVLFAAGPTDRFRRTPGGKLWAVSAEDGKLLRKYPLDSPPAADGLAAGDHRLFLTTGEGEVVCFGPEGADARGKPRR